MAQDDVIACCGRGGVITLHEVAPPLQLCLGAGSRPVVLEAVQAIARHAYDGETYLVPGIPESENERQAVDAAKRFSIALRKRIGQIEARQP